jgi:hypothetical protein
MEQDKCPVCVKKNQELQCAMADSVGTRRGLGDESNGGEQHEQAEDLKSQRGTESIVTEGLEFVEDHFGEGKGTETQDQDLGSSYGSGLADSRQEWQIVHKADVQGHDLAGVEDEVVVFGHGKEVNEVLDVDGESEWMNWGQVLPHPVASGEAPNADGNGVGLGREPERGGGGRVKIYQPDIRTSEGDCATEAEGMKQDRKSSTKVAGRKQGEQKEKETRKASWKMMGHGSWLRDQ